MYYFNFLSATLAPEQLSIPLNKLPCRNRYRIRFRIWIRITASGFRDRLWIWGGIEAGLGIWLLWTRINVLARWSKKDKNLWAVSQVWIGIWDGIRWRTKWYVFWIFMIYFFKKQLLRHERSGFLRRPQTFVYWLRHENVPLNFFADYLPSIWVMMKMSVRFVNFVNY